jgi:hypothetical protein
MQVLYGIDTTGGLAATEYVTATQVATNSALTNFNGAISVKVALLAASPPGSNSVPKPAASPMFNLLGATITAPIDTRFRQVFTATIATRNTTS